MIVLGRAPTQYEINAARRKRERADRVAVARQVIAATEGLAQLQRQVKRLEGKGR